MSDAAGAGAAGAACRGAACWRAAPACAWARAPAGAWAADTAPLVTLATTIPHATILHVIQAFMTSPSSSPHRVLIGPAPAVEPVPRLVVLGQPGPPAEPLRLPHPVGLLAPPPPAPPLPPGVPQY